MRKFCFMVGSGCVLTLCVSVRPLLAEDRWWSASSPDRAAAQWLDCSRTNIDVAAAQCLELLDAGRKDADTQAKATWLTLVGRVEFADALARISSVSELDSWLTALRPLEPRLAEVLFELVVDRKRSTEVRRRAALALGTTGVSEHRVFLLEHIALNEREEAALRAAAGEALLAGPRLPKAAWEPLRRAFRHANNPGVQTVLLRLFAWVDHPEGVSQIIEEATRRSGDSQVQTAALTALLDAARRAAEQRDRERLEPLGTAAARLRDSADPVEEAAGLCAMRWTEPAAFARSWRLLHDDPDAWRRLATEAEPRRWWLRNVVLAGELLDRRSGETELRAVQWLARLRPAPLSQRDLMHGLFKERPGWLFRTAAAYLRDPQQRTNRIAGVRLGSALPESDADLQSWELWQASAVHLAEWWSLPQEDELLAGVLRKGLEDGPSVQDFEEAVLEVCREEPGLQELLKGAHRRKLQSERPSNEKINPKTIPKPEAKTRPRSERNIN